MKTSDLIRTAVSSMLRARTRTVLTVLAIVIGAFTLTLTNGAGTGITRFVDDTVSTMGSAEVMTVVKRADPDVGTEIDGPRVYDPAAAADTEPTGPGPAPTAVTTMTQADIDALADVDGVTGAAPVKQLAVDFVQNGTGTRYATTGTTLLPGQAQQLVAGAGLATTGDARELTLPAPYVDALGYVDNDAAVGSVVTVGLTDGNGFQQTVQATVTGVSEAALGGPASPGIVVNTALGDGIYDLQQVGLPTDRIDRWSQATVQYDPALGEENVTAIKGRLVDAGFEGSTVDDQIGQFTTVISTIVLVLNAFAVIALVAAGLGIVNTLLMSVQERTREIGLMKAMGMGSRRVFALFSLEAVAIGLLGSVLGVVLAVITGTAISSALSGSLLADLPGLTVIAFDPVTVLVPVAAIVAVAFLAGTVPAIRAARREPVTALRYE